MDCASNEASLRPAALVGAFALCIDDALRHGDDAWEGNVVAAFHRLSRQHERDRADQHFLSAAWTLAHADFHHAIVAGCANTWLRRMHTTLYQQSERYRQLSAPLAEVERDVHAEHKAIAEAVVGRRAEQALSLIASHLQTTADLVLASTLFRSSADTATASADARA